MTQSGIPEIGTVLDGRYELLSVLGEGGFGVVYRARQGSTGQLVAVKVLLPARGGRSTRRAAELARFKREMQLIGKLRHAHIVRLIDFGEVDELQYMVLEYIEGLSLSAWLEQRGPLSPRLAVHLMHQVADALHHAHQHGVIHRDLKPHNIMITEGGYRPAATVLDFGIAGLLEDARDADYKGITGTRDALGTPAYMAPEQITSARGSLGAPTDLFAWGLIMAECLSGHEVAQGNSLMEILFAQAHRERVELPGSLAALPLAPIVARATARDIAARYASAAELIAELDALRPEALPETPVPVEPPASAGIDPVDMETWAGEVEAEQTARREAVGGAPHAGAATVSARGGAGAHAPARGGAGAAPAQPPRAGAGAAPAPPRAGAGAAPPRASAAPDPAYTEPDVRPPPSAPPTRAIPLLAAAIVLVLAGGGALIWWAANRDAGAAADAAPGAAPTASHETGAPAQPQPSTAPTAVPEPDLTSSTGDLAPEPASAQAVSLVTLAAREVSLGLSEAQRRALREEHGEAYELDLEPGVAALPTLTWRRPALRVMTHEVTRGQWRAHASALTSAGECEGAPPEVAGASDDAPMTGVTPLEAEALCAALGLRLPDAREWEALAQAVSLDDARLAELRAATRVGALPWNRTPEGVYDLAGGASEWVRCGGDGLAYCLDGYAHRGGSSASAAVWFVPALLEPPLPGRSARCHRDVAIGFRCVGDPAGETP